ncbi:hypothetical protein L208DRAFT_1383278 [Tricholoma matsutake]|nr:hypothetical protein L208DRAFT_1383278 [Tricholoma matsutake 945]
MSLVWVILFTKMAPHVFMELDKPLEGRNEKELTAAGVTGRPQYVMMLSTTIMALLDTNLPLLAYMRTNKNSFGEPWTTKHGMKEINAKNIVWMGFGRVKTSGFLVAEAHICQGDEDVT